MELVAFLACAGLEILKKVSGGRGSYVSERKHKIWQYVQEGMTRWDASIRAQDEVSKR